MSTPESEMPAGRGQLADPPRDGPMEPPNETPNPDGARCDFCQKKMISYLMTVADHLGWERGRKCGPCYRQSLFEDKTENQRKDFDKEVEARIAQINSQTSQLTDAKMPRVFPCIESTINVKLSGLRIRVWRKREELQDEYDDRDLMREFAKEELRRRGASQPSMTRTDVVRLIADLPGVSAIEFQDAPRYVEQSEVVTGVVAYTEWP